MKERLVARLRAEASGRYLSAAIATNTRSRIDSRTFGSLLRTRETVLVDVPAARATSSMVARIMDARSVACFRRRFGRISGGRNSLHRDIPAAHFHHWSRGSLRGVARSQGQRLAGPQRDVVVAPQDRQHEFALRGLPD